MKKLILLLILLISTGCTINYNLTINESNDFEEGIYVTSYETLDKTKEILFDLYSEESPIYIDQEFMYYAPYSKNEEYTYFEKTYTELENGYIFNYKANFEYGDYSRARSLRSVYKNSSIGYIKDTHTYYIAANYPIIFVNNKEIEQITINIKLDNWTVTDHNADQVNNNTYTWILTPDNLKAINLNYQAKEEIENPSIDTPVEISDDIIEIESEPNNNLIYIILGLFSLITIVIISISIKTKRL